jgi:cell division protein FtsW (lipid II flippase)
VAADFITSISAFSVGIVSALTLLMSVVYLFASGAVISLSEVSFYLNLGFNEENLKPE